MHTTVTQVVTENFLYLKENDGLIVENINQTCSKSGKTALSSIFVQYKSNIIPSWLTNDPSKMQLLIQTPSISNTSSYSLQIKTTYLDVYSDLKLINLQINKCLVENCFKCTSNQNICQQWSSEYSISNDSKNWVLNHINSQIKSAQTSLQVTVGVSTFIGGTLSLLNLSSTQVVWSSINQIQLYLLIPLLNIYIEAQVLVFLEGFDFSLFSLSFLNINKLNIFNKILSEFRDSK